MDNDKLYIDEPCIASFFFGEFGWFLAYWQAHLRYLKFEKYKDHKFLLVTDMQYRPIVQDFAYAIVDLPDEFKNKGLETDCYEAPYENSQSGSLTPPDVYSDMIKFMRNFYNLDKTIEILPPRGCDIDTADSLRQTFCKFQVNTKLESSLPIITVFPRGRSRAAFRNIPEYVWRDLVDKLKEEFLVILGGTPNGSFLQDYEDDNVVNMINYNEEDKLAKLIGFLNNSYCSISSQSGPTHLSLACNTPSYIIGHEEKRHTVDLNRLDTATSFRFVSDYRAIDAETILNDVHDFINILNDEGWIGSPDYNEIIKEDSNLLTNLINKSTMD